MTEGSAKTAADYFNLVYSDATTTQFIVVETDCSILDAFPGIPSNELLIARARRAANVLFCLTQYVGYEPKFVRFTTFRYK